MITSSLPARAGFGKYLNIKFNTKYQIMGAEVRTSNPNPSPSPSPNPKPKPNQSITPTPTQAQAQAQAQALIPTPSLGLSRCAPSCSRSRA